MRFFEREASSGGWQIEYAARFQKKRFKKAKKVEISYCKMRDDVL